MTTEDDEARIRQGEITEEPVDEEYERILQDAISRLNTVYILETKEHGIESAHWTQAGARAASEELKRFAAYKNASFRFRQIPVQK